MPKIAAAVTFMTIVAIFHDEYKPEWIVQPDVMKLPGYKWWPAFWLIMILKRCQYYYAWIVADAVANLSGFGFNGYDEFKRPKWDLISNVNVIGVEVSE